MRIDDEPDADPRALALQDFVARSINLRGYSASQGAAVELLGRLQDVGIRALLLKGLALERLLYLPGEHRGSYDVDVLVAPWDVGRAREVLGRLGYENRSERAGVDNFLGVVHAEMWARPRDAAIDLHWQLPGCGAPPGAVWERLSAGRGSIEIGGVPAAVPGRDALALHLALHVANHGLSGLKAKGDLVRGLERWPAEEWGNAARLAETLQATPAFAAGLRLLPEGAAMAQELGLPHAPQLTWTILHQDMRPRGVFHLRALLGAPGWPARVNIIRRSLFPRRAWVAWRFPWADRGGPTIVAGYLAHLVTAPLWAARAWKFERLARRDSQGL